RAGSATAIGDVQASQGTDAINSLRISAGLIVGRLQIAPGLGLLANVFRIIRGIEAVCDNFAGGVYDANATIVKGKTAVLLHDAKKQSWKISETGDFFPEIFHDALEPIERA